MRVVIVCHWQPGGSSTVASELAVALAERGHHVHVVSERRPLRLRDHSSLRFHAFEVFDYPLFPTPPHDLSLITKITEVVRNWRPHVIHAHYAVPHALAGLVAREAACYEKAAVVTTLHGTDVTLVGSHPSFYLLTKYAMERADSLTCVSQWLAGRTKEVFSLSRPVAVVPNFFPPEVFHASGRSPYPDGGAFELVHASNFRPVKRVTDVVRAFHMIRRELPARLTLVGQGPEMGTVRELVAELGLTTDVRFPGFCSSVGEILRRSHLYLLLSDYESFGVSALEAMACGVPVLASRAGGLPEVVRHGETGYLCRVGDFRCVAHFALQLLKDRKQWERMSQAAAQAAREDFSVHAVVSRYEQLYGEAVASR